MNPYRITRLNKEKRKGHVLPIEYTTQEYYDVGKTASSDGFFIFSVVAFVLSKEPLLPFFFCVKRAYHPVSALIV